MKTHIIDLPMPVDQAFVDCIWEFSKNCDSRSKGCDWAVKELIDECEHWSTRGCDNPDECEQCDDGDDGDDGEGDGCAAYKKEFKYWTTIRDYLKTLPKNMVIEQ
jgi:hypothetical protein